MDDPDRSGNSAHSELLDASSADQPSRRMVSVELSPWEWQLVCRVLRSTSQTMAETDVGARIVGDRLFTVEDRIATQVEATDTHDTQLD